MNVVKRVGSERESERRIFSNDDPTLFTFFFFFNIMAHKSSDVVMDGG